MLIEIHMIQNHSPANLNRDDLGAPKTCVFGGVMRARISSQCLKRSIRHPENPNDVHNKGAGIFAKAMTGHMGTRTRFFPWLVEQALLKSSIPTEERRRVVLAAGRIGTSKDNDKSTRIDEAKADPRPKTAQLIFLGPDHAAYFVQQLEQMRKDQRDCYDYYLNPVVGFQEMVRSLLDGSGLEEKEQEKIAKASWVIAKCRMKELLNGVDVEDLEEQALEQEQPGAEHAALIAERMSEIFHDDKKLFQSLVKAASKDEKSQMKEDEPKKPKPSEWKIFMDALKGANQCNAVDIALFGRMTTSEAFRDVEAAMQVAHAISTHAVTNETDYWTAVDDLGKSGGGAGHVGEALFNSACFYKYFSLNWDQLVRNLAGDEPEDQQRRDEWITEIKPAAERLAAKTLGHFLRAAAMSVPSGMQNQHASNCLPDGILVEVKKDGGTPVSYANAFAQPARKIGDPEDDTVDAVSLIGRSIAQFGDYVYSLRKAYQTNSTLLWFSPQLWKYPLKGWEREVDGKAKKAVAIASSSYQDLGGKGDAHGLVEAVVKEIGFDWHAVNGSTSSTGG